jgi:hypothetical protein
VCDEEQVIRLFYEQFTSALALLGDRYEFELLFTDNRSNDATLPIIRALRDRDPTLLRMH